MVAVSAGREPMSLIESIVLGLARRRVKTGRASSSGAFGWWVAELFGTTAAMAAFVAGAFLYALPIVGWVVLGVGLLVLDTKVSGGRRARRAMVVPAPPVSGASRIVRE